MPLDSCPCCCSALFMLFDKLRITLIILIWHPHSFITNLTDLVTARFCVSTGKELGKQEIQEVQIVDYRLNELCLCVGCALE